MRLALAGDTMLGRGVAEAIRSSGPTSLFAEEVKEATRSADLFVLNLECCISDRGERWPDRDKPFFFRAPPDAVETLLDLGVDAVTLANNHALDYGEVALLDTLDHLARAGIAVVGSGRDRAEARKPAVLQHGGFRLGVVGVTDHPLDFAASERAGVAYADLWTGHVSNWLTETVSALTSETDAVLVTPHWGPNMTSAPPPHVRAAASELADAGADVIAGHSAHVFHGVSGSVIYDMGDFIDDYAVDHHLRNDLGLLFLVELDAAGPARIEAMPLRLDHCFTRPADEADFAWIKRRFRAACAEFDTDVYEKSGRLVVDISRDE
jgi:poly-gamma-glutamate synthesis protein (capsule biosynthesis protein)